MTITRDIQYIGVSDHQTGLFEGQYRVPRAMSCNSYAILDEKIAIMDTVDGCFTRQWLRQRGCPQVVLHDLCRCDLSAAVADAFRFSKLALAATTYNGYVFPSMREFLHHLTERNYQNRTVGLMENGSWAPTAARVMKKCWRKSKISPSPPPLSPSAPLSATKAAARSRP